MLIQYFCTNEYEWGLRTQENDRTPQPRGYELTYGQFPKYYRWDKGKKVWLRRKRYGTAGTSGYIGRMRFIPPTAGSMSTFYLRILLHVVKGARSFEDMKRVEGVVQSSYKRACYLRGLIEDDAEWNDALTEASLSAMPAQIRQLFTIILTCGHPMNPDQLWYDHRDAMSEDFAWRRRRSDERTTDVQDCDHNMALLDIEDRLQEYLISDLSSYGLPTPIPVAEHDNNMDTDPRPREASFL